MTLLSFSRHGTFFICSFCADSDRNEHWHQYAQRAGYALGFKAHLLRDLALKQGFQIGPVIYDTERTETLADAIVADHIHVLENFKSPLAQADLGKVTNFVCRLFLSFAPFFKPQAFERENEWRLIKVAGVDSAHRYRLRPQRVFGVRAYYPFRFKIDSKGKARLTGSPPRNLIPNLIVGPGNESHPWLAETAPSELLRRSGFDTVVRFSTSSLRFSD